MQEAHQYKELTFKDWVGFIGLIFGMFMAVLDIQIVASSQQQIQAGLSATTDEISWIQTSYLIAEVIMIPLSGWLSRTLSTRILFTASCAMFTVMSFACAFAWDINSMIVFRALQGFFGGALIPTVFASIYMLFPKEKQPGISVLVGLVVTMAPTVGPVFGGYLSEITSWHALFLINIIPGILVCLSTWFLVDIDKPDFSLLKNIDFMGIVLIAVSLGSLEFVVEEGAKKDWFASDEILFFTIVAASTLVMAIYRELTIEHPIVDLSAFVNRNFIIGCAFSCALGVTLFNVVFLMPLYLGTIKGLSSFQIGTYMTVTGIFQFLSAPIAGTLVRKIDLRLMLFIGFTLLALGTHLNANLTADAGFWEFFLPQAVRGISLMLCFLPVNIIALGTLPVNKVKNASGLYNLMRNLGGAIGLAGINTYYLDRSKSYFYTLRNNANEANMQVSGFIENVGAAYDPYLVQDSSKAALTNLYHLTMRESSIMAFNDAFNTIALISCGVALLVFMLKKVNPDSEVAGDAH